MTPLTFAVLGHPIAHSKSPAMHRAAYRALGLPHDYQAIDTPPEALAERMEALRDGRFAGFNVTVPLKTRALALADAADPSARVVGAANTLVRLADGRIQAHNTDAPAIADELHRLAGRAPPSSPEEGLVLGDGGAARAAIAAMSQCMGLRRIRVRARGLREPGAARAFTDGLTASLRGTRGEGVRLEAGGLDADPALESGLGWVVQATSCGMSGGPPGDAVADAVAWSALPDSAVVLDVVYAPRRTPFLERAERRRLRHDHGLGMLASQGARAFELWLGTPAPLSVMRATLDA